MFSNFITGITSEILKKSELLIVIHNKPGIILSFCGGKFRDD